MKLGHLKPKWLWFEVTDRCNSRCMYCNIWRKKPTKDPLTPEEIRKILSDPLFKDVTYIINSGGEPTLRPDLKEILEIEHETLPQAILNLSTNGLLPDRAIDAIEHALRIGCIIEVGVSLDGIGEKHDSVRGVKGNFEKVNYLLHKLVELRERYKGQIRSIGVLSTLTDFTAPFLEEVRRYAERLKLDYLIQWYSESPFYDNMGKGLASKDRLLSVVKSFSPKYFGGDLRYEMWLKWLRGKSIRFRCFAMHTFCVLKCSGDIAPCLTLWDVNVGNVRDSSPSQIWRSHKAKKAREIVKSCHGCLNDWATKWSFSCSYYPYLLFYLRRPRIMLRKLRTY
jgi:MoaA/NifB/PqqE/SkfB family radical SAM enzyme